MSSESKPKQVSAPKPSFSASIVTSPLLWGGIASYGFFQLIPLLPSPYRELAIRYICGHPIEYATTVLFFMGIAILGFKAMRLSRDKAALDLNILDGQDLAATSDPVKRVEQIERKLRQLPASAQGSLLGTRLYDVCQYVRSRKSAEKLEEHLKYIAELAVENLHGSYALVRTITWAIPILGFLGTVLGITIAIANITPEQLEKSMNDVVGGLALAFDTTALSLALSLPLVFGSFLVERAEGGVLSRVEEFGINCLGSWFPTSSKSTSPLAKAEAEASQQLLAKTESLITWQTELWQESLESLRDRWTTSIDGQKKQFDEAIRLGLATTLSSHAQQLEQVRGEFVSAFRTATSELVEAIGESRSVQQDTLRQFTDRLSQLVDKSAEKVSIWQDEIAAASSSSAAQFDELRKQRELLLEIVGEGRELSRLESQLSGNLAAIRATDTFEETLHSLSAAVNLLATRARQKAA